MCIRDSIQGEILYPRLPRGLRRRQHLIRRMATAKPAQLLPVGGLHPQRQPVAAGGGKTPQRFLQLVGGIGFQGDFCPLQAKNFP